MKKEIMSGAPSIEQKKVVDAAIVLFEAAKRGVAPPPEARKQLIDLWQKVSDKSLAVAEKEPADFNIKSVKRVIDEYAHDELVVPGHRGVGSYVEKRGMNASKFDGRIILASLETSLRQEDSFEVIARKVNMLHDYAEDVGGGQYAGRFCRLPDTKKLLLQRLIKEVKSGRRNLDDVSFCYVFNRLGGNDMEWVGGNRIDGFNEMSPKKKLLAFLAFCLD